MKDEIVIVKGKLIENGFTIAFDDMDRIKGLWKGDSKLYLSSAVDNSHRIRKYHAHYRQPSFSFDRLYKYIYKLNDGEEKRDEAIAEGISGASFMLASILKSIDQKSNLEDITRQDMEEIAESCYSTFVQDVLVLKEGIDNQDWDGSESMRESFIGLYSAFKEQQFFTFNNADFEHAFKEGNDIEYNLVKLYESDPEFYLNVIESPFYPLLGKVELSGSNSELSGLGM